MTKHIETIVEYFRHNRQVGHTTAMMRGANNVDDVIILVGNDAQRNNILRHSPRAEVIALSNLRDGLYGKTKPLLIDNVTWEYLWEEYKELAEKAWKYDELQE